MPYPDDNLRTPDAEGKPPRPATEPAGAEHSTRNRHSETDPATGVPISGDRAEKLTLPDGPHRD